MEVAVLLTVGKYLFLVCLYVFVLAVFRGMMRQLAAVREDEPGLEAGDERRGYAKSTRREAPPPAWAPEPPQPSRASSLQPPTFAKPSAVAKAMADETADKPASAVPHLVVLEAAEGDAPPGAEIPLSAAVTMGRDDENSIPLQDRYVSGHHLLICLREGRRILVDRGSTNGTLVNGHQVDAEVELAGGDQFGKLRGFLEIGYYSSSHIR